VLARSAYTLAYAADHGVSVALYLRELDSNDVELYWDRPEANKPRQPDGTLAMFTHALDLQALLHLS
jgi:catechol 2,3-dioxygenase